jgi:hypothetical protein
MESIIIQSVHEDFVPMRERERERERVVSLPHDLTRMCRERALSRPFIKTRILRSHDQTEWLTNALFVLDATKKEQPVPNLV